MAIPQEVFDETQYYRQLPHAMEIAKAVGKWLAVKRVKNRKQVQRLLEQKLGEGEAEAIILNDLRIFIKRLRSRNTL